MLGPEVPVPPTVQWLHPVSELPPHLGLEVRQPGPGLGKVQPLAGGAAGETSLQAEQGGETGHPAALQLYCSPATECLNLAKQSDTQGWAGFRRKLLSCLPKYINV